MPFFAIIKLFEFWIFNNILPFTRQNRRSFSKRPKMYIKNPVPLRRHRVFSNKKYPGMTKK